MDVSEANFQTAVIERSREVPVVIDFWATWCGPCRQLGPALERAVAARAPRVELAKVDTDANPRLAQAFRIQSIPAVKAIKDGAIVSEFLGAVPPAQIEAFLDELVPPDAGPAPDLQDEAALRAALVEDPTQAELAVALAELLLTRDEPAEAAAVLAEVVGSFAADGLRARIALQGQLSDGDGGAPSLAGAFGALDTGDLATALDLLLSVLPDAGEAREDVRKVIVGVLDRLGPEDELARSSRRRLAAALYY